MFNIQYPIFMGAGERTEARCKQLHECLDLAFTLLGGTQQPQACTEKFDPGFELQQKGDKQTVQGLAAHIYASLTGEFPNV